MYILANTCIKCIYTHICISTTYKFTHTCGVSYSQNPSCEQSAQDVSVAASAVGNSGEMFLNGVAIASVKMDHDLLTTPASGFAVGDAAPLKVCALEIISASISQSSSHPCDTSTLTLSNFKTNVPILKTRFCFPTLIISGLAKAIASNGKLDLVATANGEIALHNTDTLYASANITAENANGGTWNGACNNKSLTLHVQKNITSHETAHTLAWVLQNPATGQTAVPITLTVAGCGSSGSSCTSITHALGPAMNVTTAVMNAKIRQASSFPCDGVLVCVEETVRWSVWERQRDVEGGTLALLCVCVSGFVCVFLSFFPHGSKPGEVHLLTCV